MDGRRPPQDVEAEQAVLGAMMINPAATAEVTDILNRGDFYRSAHRHIFAAVLDLLKRSEAIDVLTVRSALDRQGLLDEVGGSAYLTQLAGAVYSAANVEAYARQVADAAQARRLFEHARQICIDLLEPGTDSYDQIIDRAQDLVMSINARDHRAGLVHVGEITAGVVLDLEGRRAQNQNGRVFGLPTGIKKLDRLTDGLHPGEMWVIGGRPKMGKTTLATQIAYHASTYYDRGAVALFSLEMSDKLVCTRLLAGLSGVDSFKIRQARLDDGEWHQIKGAGSALKDLPLYIDHTATIPVEKMLARARALKSRLGLSLVVVDYIQLIPGDPKIRNRVQQVTEISRSLKIMAKTLDVPVIAVSQLSRGLESRDDKRPRLSDLRESGAIEQDADLVLFVYRDEVYNKKSRLKGTAELIIGAQRSGPSEGTVVVSWDPATNSMGDLGASRAREIIDEIAKQQNVPF